MNIQHLYVSGFRGIGDALDLPLTHRTIFYGPNGSGKSSVLQSIAWALYGILPTFSGGVFVKEDAFVNDFTHAAQTKVELTFSTGEVISRSRNKQSSTTRGSNPLLVSFPVDDTQSALENLIGLNAEEFFASVFLHQETIRDFLTTSPEKRSATIDRMIGTYLLRALIKSVDPRIPDKAITQAKANIEAIDHRLSSATVISREVIDRKKTEYGDPATLPEKLEEIQFELEPIAEQLGLPVPGVTVEELTANLDDARSKQMELVRLFTAQTGDFSALKQRYEQASDTNWEAVRRQRVQYGDPANLPMLLQSIRDRLAPLHKRLGLPEPSQSLYELRKDLDAARRAQNLLVGRLIQETADLNRLKDQYHQAVVTDWQGLNERKAKWGDTKALPDLLQQIQANLSPYLKRMGIPIPQPTLSAFDEGLSAAQRLQPREVSRLERLASDCLDMKTRFVQAKQNVVESPVIPNELLTSQANLDSLVKNLNNHIIALNKQIGERDALIEEITKLRDDVNEIQTINLQILEDQSALDHLEQQSQQSELYSQLLVIGQRYLEQSRPEQCPLCKQSIEELDIVLSLIGSEIPADIEKTQKEIQQYKDRIGLLRNRAANLEGKQSLLDRKEVLYAAFSTDLDLQVTQANEDLSKAVEHLTTVNAEVDKLKARINMAEDSRRKLDAVVIEIEQLLNQTPIPDPQSALELATQSARKEATEIKNIDFQPIVNELNHAKQLDDMAKEEERLQHKQQVVLDEVTKTLGDVEEAAVPRVLDNAIHARHQQAEEIQAIEFQSIATDLDQASQLNQILEEEALLQKQLDRVQGEVRQKLNLADEEKDFVLLLDKAVQDAQNQAKKINKLDLHSIETKLQRVRQMVEIVNDEEKLRSLENSYQTARREKDRLNYRIGRLVELRNALHDISETTKRHQEVIVSDVLNNLDIARYYKELDPHPAYTELQIEPEPSAGGTYKYWIKARTADFDHSAYVQARFSTAQANCAAIAIFLAVNQHLSKNLEAVLLDDPSQSMDPDHKERLAKTLASNPRQVIVATEDPQMFSFLRDSFVSPVIYELQPWTTRGTGVTRS
jgi:DNA repair exonuclease SbcCD ATPase subunit